MAQSSAHRSPCPNPHNGKDEFAGKDKLTGKNELTGKILTKGSNRRTPVLAATRAHTSAAALVVAPPTVSGSTDSPLVRYSKDDL